MDRVQAQLNELRSLVQETINSHLVPIMDGVQAQLNGLQSLAQETILKIRLVIAVKQGRINETIEILNFIKISNDIYFHYYIIMLALDSSQTEIAKLIIENYFPVYKKSEGRTILHAAVESSTNTELITTLLVKGASQDILALNTENKTPFHLAIDKNQLSTIKLFLSHCNVKTLDEKNFLHYAIEQDKIELVTELIREGFSMNRKNKENLTPFCVAWKNENSIMLHQLLSFCKGENIEPNNYNDVAPVYIASMCGYLELVKKYADFGLSINKPLKSSTEIWSCLTDCSGFTLLHFAVKHVELEVVNFLLSTGADIVVQNDNGSTPLHIAFETKERGIWKTWQLFDNNNLIIDLMLKANMELQSNPVNQNGLSHFHIACSTDETTVVEHFLKLGAVINQPTKSQCYLYKGFYPLHFAAKFRCRRTLELLLEKGADVKQKDFKEMTALHIAAKESCLDGVRLLLEYGADVTSIDSYGNSPVHWAFQNKNYAIIDLLLSIHIEVHSNPTNADGLSHFHIACTRNNVRVVKNFITNGVLIDTCVSEQSDENEDSYAAYWGGYSALHFAVSHNRAKIVQLLLNSGASVDLKASNGYTPLHLACQYTYEMFGEFIKTTLYDFHKRGNVVLQLKPVTEIAEVFEAYLNGFNDCTKKISWLANRTEHLKIINLLLSYRSDVNCMDDNSNTPVFYAYAAVTDVRYNLQNNLNYCSETLCNQIVEILSEELYERRKLILNNLLKLDVNLNNCHQYGSILHYICATNNANQWDVEMMQLFLENGANVNAYNQCYYCKMCTPLHVATEAKNENLIRTLLEYDANVDCIYPLQYNRTPLLINTFETKSWLMCANIMKILVDKGANVNARQSDGKTALHSLALRSEGLFLNHYLISNLIKASANINSQDCLGSTPLHLACLTLNYQIAESLLKFGADINIEDSGRNSVCYYLYASYLHNVSISDRDNLSLKLKGIIKLLQNHVMKMNVIGLPVSRKELSSYAKFYDFLPRTDREINELIDKYKDEVQILQTTNINGYFTLYDVIFKNENALAKLVKNRAFKSIVESKSFKQAYPNYGCLVQSKYQSGMDRAKLLPTAKCVLKNMIGLHLPDSCSEKIFSYFSNFELNESIQVVSKLLNYNKKSSSMQLRKRRTCKRQKVY